MNNINLFGDDLLPNKEQIKLHMFSSRMKNRVVSKRDSAGIITENERSGMSNL